MISCHLKILYVHTNIFEIKDQEIEEDEKISLSDSNENNSSTICDITKITQKLDCTEVNQLKYRILNSNIDISQEEINSIQNVVISESSEEKLRILAEDASYGLKIRLKGQKLSTDQIHFIKELCNDPELKIIDICRAYNISPSLIYKIKRSVYDQLKKSKSSVYIKHFGSKKLKLINFIREFVIHTKSTFTAKDVTRHINLMLNSEYSIKAIRDLMKTQMNMTFKRVKSRPTSIDLQKINNVRSLFAIKYLKETNEKTLTINIDESSLNKEIKTKYSWGIKGKPLEVKNCSFTGSISCILAVCSNGSWIRLLWNSSVDSSKFTWFIKIMKNWLNKHNNFGFNRVEILLDNCSYHKSNETLSLLRKLRYKIYFIPTYTPEFAPIEMCFSLLKRNLSERCKTKESNYYLNTIF